MPTDHRAHPTSPPRAPRVEGIDIARGIASIIMIQGHAYDGWVDPAFHDTTSYRFTRLLGTLPLPAFLLLAGAAVALRTQIAADRGESASRVRRKVMTRGAQIVAYGYGLNLLSWTLDGGPFPASLLRADVLHVIGLGILALAWLGIRGSQTAPDPWCPVRPWYPVRPWCLVQRSGVVGLGAVLLCPWISRWSAQIKGPAAYVVGLVADVPGVTSMPWVPLVGWMSAGIAAAHIMRRERARRGDDSQSAVWTRAGAPRSTLWWMSLTGVLLALLGHAATQATVAQLGGPLARTHIAVWFNAIDLAGRGLSVLSAGALLTPYLSEPIRNVLLLFGRRSLVAYIVHIPLCYGLPARGIAYSLDMPSATALVLALIALCYATVRVADR